MWKPGDQILLREVYDGRVWTATPVVVASDEKEVLALFTRAGTVRQRPVGSDGQYLRLPQPEWSLAEEVCELDSLRLVTPGSYYSVLLFWTPGQQEFLGWYVNLENPLIPTPEGFDFLDQVLDIVGSPDKTEWRWKDEGELLQAQSRGLISSEKACTLRREGERAINSIRLGVPPFDRAWEQWRADQTWPVPLLPQLPRPAARAISGQFA
jgi:Protein of unknown function (DUF402)